jgi:hypothetical protein
MINMPQKTDRFPSFNSRRNDRGNHLGNAQDHLRLISKTAKRLEDSDTAEIAEQDFLRLLELVDKCANTLKKYINVRNFMGRDELVAEINSELGENPEYEDFGPEIDWLRVKFGELSAEKCRQFIQSGIEIDVRSVETLYEKIVEFREQFKRVYGSASWRENFEQYLDEILKIAIGVALFCEDGLKYYKPSGFSVRSIWLGSRMFLDGAKNLLELGTAGEM